MAQNDRLGDLVNSIEQESRQFATFEEFLANQKKEQTCQKGASDVAVNSSSDSNGKAVETGASSEPSSAVPVSEPTAEEKEAERLRLLEERRVEIERGLKTEQLAHPVAPNVTAPEPNTGSVQMAQTVTTRLEVKDVEWAGAHQQYISEVSEVDTTEPDWWKQVFHAGKKFAMDCATLEEAIVHNAKLEEAIKKIRCSQQGLRAGLAERTRGANNETKAKVAKGLEGYKLNQNAKSAERMKTERAPKAKVPDGMKLADTMATVMGMDAEEIIMELLDKGKLTPEVRAYVAKKYGAK